MLTLKRTLIVLLFIGEIFVGLAGIKYIHTIGGGDLMSMQIIFLIIIAWFVLSFLND